MLSTSIIKLLTAHNIEYISVNDRIKAIDYYKGGTTTYIDVTNYTKSQLYAWLGY